MSVYVCVHACMHAWFGRAKKVLDFDRLASKSPGLAAYVCVYVCACMCVCMYECACACMDEAS